MFLKCSYTTPLRRDDCYDYITPITIDVVQECNEGRIVVGKLEIDKVHWCDGQHHGIPLLEVCDADSEGLAEVHRILADAQNQQVFRDDLNLNEFYLHLIFISRFLLHPDVDRAPVLSAVINAVSTDSAVVVMWQNAPSNTELSDTELASLGFRKIAGESLIYRDNHYRTPFGDAHPSGLDVEFEATPEHERWLRRTWSGDGGFRVYKMD